MFISRNRTRIGAVLDIGSDAVSAARVEYSPTSPPSVLEWRQFPFDPSRRRIEEVLKTMKLSLHEACELVSRMSHRVGQGRVARVDVVLSSPWFVSKTVTVRMERSSPILITRDVVRSLLAGEEEKFTRSLIEEEKITHDAEVLTLLEEVMVSVQINGYTSARPFGAKAKMADLSFHMSAADTHVVSLISDTVGSALRGVMRQYHTSALVTSTVLRDVEHDTTHFMIVNVGGETTDVSVVKDGVLRETVTIPLGRAYFIERVSKGTRTIPAVALSFVRLYLEGKIEPAVKSRIEAELRPARSEWSAYFGKAIARIAIHIFVPQNIFLISEPDVAQFFLGILKDERLHQFGVLNFPFEVQWTDSAYYSKFCRAKSADVPVRLLSDATYIARHPSIEVFMQ